MNKKIIGSSLVLASLLAGGYYYLQYYPKVDSLPTSSPIANLNIENADGQMPLTTDVLDPAGITYLPQDQTYIISTDNREIIEVSSDFKTVLNAMTLPANPYAIGDTEGVAYLGDGKIAVIGENGVVILMHRTKTGWSEDERFPIEGFVSGTQLGSATYDSQTKKLYTAQKKGLDKQLYIIDLATRSQQKHPLSLSANVQQIPGRTWQEFSIAGMHFVDGKLYAISEPFSSVLTIDPIQAKVINITGITGINESSGLSMVNGNFLLLGDAENYLPKPPIYIVNKAKLGLSD
ncbi:MAG: SdiA-regulated domain-containing protein [OCS116 cluster bacterium]|nr:SdiA-regulated domain-containing protein [OCS116 cluster bacterium]